MDIVIDIAELHDYLSQLVNSISVDKGFEHLIPLAQDAEERCDSLLIDVQRTYFRGETSTSRISC